MRDEVVSFSWQPRPRVPGACALTLPPTEGANLPQRREWLFLTMGMSQPLDGREVRDRRAQGLFHSGLGYELGVLTDAPATWPAKLLYDLITYVTEPDAEGVVGWGDRFALGIYVVDGAEQAFVGAVDLQPIGELRGLLVWPYLPKPFFLTSTGKADVLIATGITQGEWDLAKSTSSPHLLLWLTRMGIGQRTSITRACLTRDPAAMAEWANIRALSNEEAFDQLKQSVKR
jgi:hypothetical protein